MFKRFGMVIALVLAGSGCETPIADVDSGPMQQANLSCPSIAPSSDSEQTCWRLLGQLLGQGASVIAEEGECVSAFVDAIGGEDNDADLDECLEERRQEAWDYVIDQLRAVDVKLSKRVEDLKP